MKSRLSTPIPVPPMPSRVALLLATLLLLPLLACQAAEGTWLTDFDKAKTQAKEEKKLILMDFTGSDWCPPCKALHKNVFSQEEFVKFAKDNLVLLEIDFPRRKPQSPEMKRANQELAGEYKVDGYPTIILADSTGKVLTREVGYQGDDAASFIAKVKKAQTK